MRTKKFGVMMLCMLLVAGFLYGCGSSSKEGSGATTIDTIKSVGDTVCRQCHSAVLDPLTGEGIIAQYDATSPHRNSAHANNGNGCEACHGGGAEHNGIGPIPYPNPFKDNGTRCAACHAGPYATNAPTKFADSRHAKDMTIEEGNPCRRCHTAEGAVLGAQAGLTGPGDVMSNASYQGAVPAQKEFTAFECATCHEHGGGLRRINSRDAAGNIVLWNPSGSNEVNDQYNLCTGCHGLKTNDGKVMASGSAASGTAAVGYHNNTWYRIIATTHNNNLDNTANGITGYVIRTGAGSPCFDCHGHEARTETQNNPFQSTFVPGKSTIHRDWALSGHAGRLLEAKYAAAGSGARTVEQVDAVMNAAAGLADPWAHYDWSAKDRQDCQMCHTSTGFANYATNSAAYDPTKNDYSHLAGWGGRSGTKTSKQREMLYCWGCHRNTSSGLLRVTNGEARLSFKLNDQPVIIQNIGKSAVCVICHGGRGSVGALVAQDSRSSRFQGHHAPTAGVMFASQTHIAYEYAGKNYANPAFQHYKINADTDGPCVSCHMPGANHTFKPVETDAGDTIVKINNQALCNTCHNMTPQFLEERSGGYEEASQVLNNYVSNAAGFKNYLNLAITNSNYNDKVAVPNDAYGAYQNGKLIGDEPCAYVHNPTYAKRIIFDSIDFMDNGKLDGTISIDATAFPNAAAWLGRSGASGIISISRP